MTVRVALVDCGSRKVPELARLLELHGARCARVALDDVERRVLARSDALVISGGAHLFTSEPELVERFAFIDGLALPMLGICLGHQAIGLRRGARAFLGEPRRAPEPIELRAAHPLLDGLGRSVVFGEDHCEGISLPPGFELLGSSPHYPVEIMAAAREPVFGVQFHPEISGEPGAVLLRNFLGIASAAAAATGRGR